MIYYQVLCILRRKRNLRLSLAFVNNSVENNEKIRWKTQRAMPSVMSFIMRDLHNTYNRNRAHETLAGKLIYKRNLISQHKSYQFISTSQEITDWQWNFKRKSTTAIRSSHSCFSSMFSFYPHEVCCLSVDNIKALLKKLEKYYEIQFSIWCMSKNNSQRAYSEINLKSNINREAKNIINIKGSGRKSRSP